MPFPPLQSIALILSAPTLVSITALSVLKALPFLGKMIQIPLPAHLIPLLLI